MTRLQALHVFGFKNDSPKFDEIRARYRELAKTEYPTTFGADESGWLRIKEAYDELAKDEKKLPADLSLGKITVLQKRLKVNLQKQRDQLSRTVNRMASDDPRIEKMMAPLREEETKLRDELSAVV